MIICGKKTHRNDGFKQKIPNFLKTLGIYEKINLNTILRLRLFLF